MSAVALRPEDDPDETEVFALRRLVREVLAESTDPSPHIVAKQVLDVVPDEHLRTALAAALPEYVRHVAVGSRSSVTHPGSPRSEKWQQASSMYLAFLRRREFIDGDEWKYLGDCTKGDLLRIVDVRKIKAHENLQAAERYQRLAGLLDKYGVDQVRDLPPEGLGEATS